MPMFRRALIATALLAAPPCLAQAAAAPATAPCLVRVNAAPSAWLIQGYDPFGGTAAEATFGATFTNDGEGECRFRPIFQLDQPPFGLRKDNGSSGNGKPINYALLSMWDSQDVTPRAGRSQRMPSQRELVLRPHEARTLLYKLVADPDDVREAGDFTQNVTLEAQDSQYRSLGGARLVLGLNILPSARIGLTGAYATANGHAVVDLGELRTGLAPVPLQLRVNSTSSYELNVTSANAGRLRLGSTDWYVPYDIAIGHDAVNLTTGSVISAPKANNVRRDSLPIKFIIGDTAGRRAGTYSDTISISVTAR